MINSNISTNISKGIVLALSTAFISGFSIFINYFGVKGINPYVFTGLKNLIVALIVSLLILFILFPKRIQKLSSRQWLYLLLIGLTGGSIAFLLFFKGLSLASASFAGFIHKTLFLWASFLALIILKEKIDPKFFWAGLFILSGNFLIYKLFSIDNLNNEILKGSFYIFLATLLWSFENVIARKLIREKISPLIVIWGRMFFGVIVIGLFLLLSGNLSYVFTLNPSQFKWILITSIFLLGYVLTFYHSLAYLKISQATSILTFATSITLLLYLISRSVFPEIIQKQITQLELLGAGLIAIGVLIVLISSLKTPSFLDEKKSF